MTAQGIVLGTNLQILTPRYLENLLRGFHLLREGKWSDRVREKGIVLDLSHLQYFDVGALVQAILLVDAALRGGVSVELRTPDRARHPKVVSFLSHILFSQAIRFDHLPHAKKLLTIREGASGEALTQPPPLVARSGVDAPTFRNNVPLKWVTSEFGTPFSNLEKFLRRVVGDPARGVEVVDAAAISNVIVHELLQNISQHSGGTSPGLISVWARPLTQLPEPEMFTDPEVPYLEWLQETRQPLVEIIVGDSGIGIPAALGDEFQDALNDGRSYRSGELGDEANILQWAFDRWSSSKDRRLLRGTRGLYRVDRLVQKYHGSITLRSGKSILCRDHGGSANCLIRSQSGLAMIPGTVLRVRLPAYHEVAPRRYFDISVRPTRVVFISLGPLNDLGLSIADLEKLKSALASNSTPATCIALSIRGGMEKQEALSSTIRSCVEMRHPAALVLTGLPGGSDLVDGAVDAINQQHERERHADEAVGVEQEIWDPVLVISDDQRLITWAGVSSDEQSVLEVLAASGKIDPARLREILPDPKRRGSVVRRLRADAHLVKEGPDGTLEVQFPLDSVLVAAAEAIKRHAAPGNLGVRAGPFVTPSLTVARQWINPREFLDATGTGWYGFMYLGARISAVLGQMASSEFDFVLLATTRLRREVSVLRRYLGATRLSIVASEGGVELLRGVDPIKDHSRVLIYSDIVGSGEEIRHMLAQSLRNNAVPIAAACLLDCREDDSNTIELWGTEIPLFSVAKYPVVSTWASDIGKLPRIDPVTRDRLERPTEADEFTPRIASADLERLIRESAALHLSHIGRPRGRHFTFYLLASRLVRHPELPQYFLEAIDEWAAVNSASGRNSSHLEIWYPKTTGEDVADAPAGYLARSVAALRAQGDLVRGIEKIDIGDIFRFSTGMDDLVATEDVVIIDVGSVTGTTIQEMVRRAARAGARRIFSCVLLSQLPEESAAFLRGLRSIETTAVGIDHTAPQGELPFANEVTTRQPARVSVYIEFLSQLNLRVYDAGSCPVCSQLSRLAIEKTYTALLGEFAKTQLERRLVLRSPEDATRFELPQDLDSRPVATQDLLWMLDIRLCLERALSSTTARLMVLQRLEAILAEVLESGLTTKAAILVLNFLSVEGHWFRRPPLSTRRLRETLANLSLFVALDRECEERDRCNASIVLRTASKQLFGSRFAELLASAAQSDELMRQLLYNAFTAVARPYLQSPSVLSPLEQQLLIARDRVVENLSDPSGLYVETLNALVALCRRGMATGESRDFSHSESWLRLRSLLDYGGEAHPDVPRLLSYLRPGLDQRSIELRFSGGVALLQDRLEGWVRRLHEYWDQLATFLDRSILPLLNRLEGILASHDGEIAIGVTFHGRLLDLVRSCDPVALGRTSRILESWSRRPVGGMTITQEEWKYYNSELSFLDECLFRPALSGGLGAALIEYLRTCPVEICLALQRWKESLAARLPNSELVLVGIQEPILIFCTQRLFLLTCDLIEGNLRQHRTDESTLMLVVVRISSDPEAVYLTIANSNSSSHKRAGVALASLERQLKSFEISMKPETRPQDEGISFEITFSFRRY